MLSVPVSCINDLPKAFKVALDNVLDQTGWVGTIFLGGPSPTDGQFTTMV